MRDFKTTFTYQILIKINAIFLQGLQSATIKDLKDIRMVISTTSPLNLPIWLTQKMWTFKN